MDIRSLCHPSKDKDTNSPNQLQPNKRPRLEVKHNLASSKIAKFEEQPMPNVYDEQQHWQSEQRTNKLTEGEEAVAIVEEICLGLVRSVLPSSKHLGGSAN